MDRNKKTKTDLLKELDDLKLKLSELQKKTEDYESIKTAMLDGEQRYRVLFESSKDAIMVLEPPGWSFTDANQATLEMFRAKDKEEFLSSHPWHLAPKYQNDGELSLKKARKLIKKTIQEGSAYFEWIHKRFDGDEFPATVLLTRIKQKGKTYLEATVRDITKEKQNENELYAHRKHLQELLNEQIEELKKSELQFRTLSENIPGVVYLCKNDEKYSMIYINDEVEKLTGYTSKEFLNDKVNFVEIYHPDDKDRIMSEVDRALAKKEAFHLEYQIKHRKGHWCYIEEFGTGVFHGDKLQFLEGFLHDVTERRRSDLIRQVMYDISNAATTSSNLNDLIRLIRFQLGKLIDTTNFFIALYDEATDSISLQYIADQSEKVTIFPAGKTLTAYVIKSKKALLANQKTIKKLNSSGEIELIGEMAMVWLGVPLKVEGKIIGVIVVQSYSNENAYTKSDLEILEFVSEQISLSILRKKTEEDLKAALKKSKESDRLKSVFLGNMSHEFRTPLNTIIGFSDIIDKNTPADEVIDFVKTINESGKHLLALVENIFDISMIETGEIKIMKDEFQLSPFMKNILNSLLKEQKSISEKKLKISYSAHENDENGMIITDGRQLNQILLNLLNNAIKFTNDGYVKFGYSSEIINDQPVWLFYVKDSGIGISKEKQQFIFDIFRQGDDTYTRRYDGVGIGLSLSKKMTELLGGRMWLESEAGKGSSFYFTLPMIKKI